jgi:putative redox protein
MPTRAVLTWTGVGLQFEGQAVNGPAARFDGDGKAGPSPVITLLLSLAACMSSDVVSIVEKMQIPLASLVVDVEAERALEHPRRILSARMTFRARGGEPQHEERVQHAIDLSREKYCSVLHSLREDIQMTHVLEFEPA